MVAKVIEELNDGIRLLVFIQPKSSKNEIVGPHNGALKIKITAPPVDGKANQALIEFLSELLRIPKRNIELLKGDTGRNKSLFIHGIKEADFKAKLKIEI